jgi:sphinganine-1-phosphate aldolase
LSNLAVKHRIPLHVDCCLGSFIVPFLSTNGFPSPLFDFRLPGVTSISCDTHKYGFAPKGNSVLMYRNRTLRAYQYYITTTWPGGVYASPSIAGSRPGALIAGTWTSLMTIGREGYRQSCHDIVSCARYIKHEVSHSFGTDLYVLGDPLVSVVSFSSKTLNIYDVADTMSELGWHLNALQDPPAVHIACTKPTVAAKEKFITDLKEAVLKVKLKGEGAAKGDTAALYGVAGSLPNRSVMKRMAEGFIDLLYKA